MATTTNTYTVAHLDQLEVAPSFNPDGNDDGRARLDVRNHFGITSFGINAVRIPGAGNLIREHDESGIFSSRQEELYLVLDGAATFEIDGETVEAPAGTFVYARPEARRSATASDQGATVLMLGGTPGKAFEPLPAEAAEAFNAYNAGDYEKAAEKQRAVLEQKPDSILVVYNAACFEAMTGKTEEAIGLLQRAVEIDERVKENIRDDSDLDSLREDPRFEALTK